MAARVEVQEFVVGQAAGGGGFCEPECFSSWRDHLECQGKGVHTISAYLSDLRLYARWVEDFLGMRFFPFTINSYDIRAYRKHCRVVERVAGSTLNRRLASLRAFCEWGVRSGQITLSVEGLFEGVRAVRGVRQAPNWLDERDYHRFMRTVEIGVNTGRQVGSKAKGPTEYGRLMAVRDWAMVSLMALAGLRVGEVVGLRAGDVVMGERSGEVRVYGGKGDKDRVVPLTRDLRRALGMWLDLRGDGDGPLFVGRRGGGLGVNGVQERVGVIAGAAGLVGVTPHRFRHTFARRFMLKNRGRLGDDCLMMLKELMGHERLETTMQYARPGRSEMAAALEDL